MKYLKCNPMSKPLNKNELIRLSNVSKHYGEKAVVDAVSVSINAGDKITLVGGNGAGKSTLMKLLAGEIQPDNGSVDYQRNITLSYLAQDLKLSETQSIIEFVTENIPALNQLGKMISETILKQKAAGDTNDSTELNELKKEFNALGGFKIGKILSGLQLSHLPWEINVSLLSGGQQTRVALAKILFENADVTLLDEPTNHLDIDCLQWLEQHINKSKNCVILITHDRALLDKTTQHIFELNTDTHSILPFKGRYLDFLDYRRRRLENALKKHNELLKEEKQIFKQIEKQNVIIDSETQMKDNDKLAYKARGEGVSRSTSRILRRHHARLDTIEALMENKPKTMKAYSWQIKANATDKPEDESSSPICEFKNLSLTLGSHLLFENISGSISKQDKIILQGANGAGKSSFLKVLLGMIPADGGSVKLNSDINIGYLSQLHTGLPQNLTVLEMIEDEIGLAQTDAVPFLLEYCLLEEDFLDKEIKALSIGQQRRIQLALILSSHPDLLILDEPTNHLDLMSCEYLEAQLLQYEGCLLAVSHDRWFINKLNAEVWHLENKALHIELSNNDQGK